MEAFRSGQQLYAIKGPASLAPGASLDWPLWLHPRASGELIFHYVWYYEPLEAVNGMKYRLDETQIARKKFTMHNLYEFKHCCEPM